MKSLKLIGVLYLTGLLASAGGCRQDAVVKGGDREPDQSAYGPRRVDIMPITEYVRGGNGSGGIEVYVSLKDAFGCSIKAPAVFRFELYEYVSLSSDPRGRRAAIWPDFDLLEAAANNERWRDFLRSYEFKLPCNLEAGRRYLLQATCLCPKGRRLMGQSVLRVPPVSG
jgi:hypothetical protein